jgi:hypothetical protein
LVDNEHPVLRKKGKVLLCLIRIAPGTDDRILGVFDIADGGVDRTRLSLLSDGLHIVRFDPLDRVSYDIYKSRLGSHLMDAMRNSRAPRMLAIGATNLTS